MRTPQLWRKLHWKVSKPALQISTILIGPVHLSVSNLMFNADTNFI